jgi:hypothetical protein
MFISLASLLVVFTVLNYLIPHLKVDEKRDLNLVLIGDVVMKDLAQEIATTSERAVSYFQGRAGAALDYSEASLAAVEELLEEASEFVDGMTEDQLDTLSQDFGCYILEVARRKFGGRYSWFNKRSQPVLVVGEPTCRVALITWDKVRSRLSGDKADNIPFFYAGFAEAAREAKPGTDVLYV